MKLCTTPARLTLFTFILVARSSIAQCCEIPENAQITSTTADAGDAYGSAVSIDGEIVICGSPLDDTAAGAGGSATVFRSDGFGWAQEDILVASDANAGDQLGFAVSVKRDLALCGAPQDDVAGSNSGSTYVFRFNGSSWVQEIRLTPSDGAAGDEFGYAVALGSEIAVVGSPGDSHIGGSDAGSVYVFRYNAGSGTWSEEQKLTVSTAESNDRFGYSVAIDGDTIIVGAPEPMTVAPIGKAYIFRFNGSTWEEEQQLAPADVGPGDLYGRAVAISGEVAVIGSLGDDDAASGAGAAYVFRESGGAWSQEIKLTACFVNVGARFGESVAVSMCSRDLRLASASPTSTMMEA